MGKPCNVNLMHYYFPVLSSGAVEVHRTDEFLQNCGVSYCAEFAGNLSVSGADTDVTNGEEDRSKIVIMSAIYLSCALASVIIVAVLVDPLKKYVSMIYGNI